jgi:adenosyl cobinamide kinase/adenosyl cobinamide phosphate guanylyltransferase
MLGSIMKILVTGPHRCGKSAYAERKLADSATSLAYFGTLDRKPGNEQRIIEHQRRRDERWVLLERSQDIQADLRDLTAVLRERPLLIDGLYLFVEGMLLIGMRIHSVREQICRLLNLPGSRWIVVDPVWRTFISDIDGSFADAMREIHIALAENCGAACLPIAGSRD